MGSIECMLIGEQAKKFREAAGITIEEFIENREGFTKQDIINFENGELYSSEVIHNFHRFYFQVIEQLYMNKGISFIAFIESYCKDNDFDKDSFLDSYYISNANEIINHHNKKLATETVKNYMLSFQFLMNIHLIQNDAMNRLTKSVNKYEEIVPKLLDTVERYSMTQNENSEYFEMVDILSRAISLSNHKDEIIKDITEEMKMCKDEDFPEYSEESYKKTITSLNTYWD